MLQDKTEYYLVINKESEFKFNIRDRYLHWEANYPIYGTTCGDIFNFILPDLIRIDDVSQHQSVLIFNIYKFHSNCAWNKRFELLYADSEPIIQQVDASISELVDDEYRIVNDAAIKNILTGSYRLLKRLYEYDCISDKYLTVLSLFVTAQVCYKLTRRSALRSEIPYRNRNHRLNAIKYCNVISEIQHFYLSLSSGDYKRVLSSYTEYIAKHDDSYAIGYYDNTGKFIYLDYHAFLNKFYMVFHSSDDVPSVKEFNRILYSVGALIPKCPVGERFTVTVGLHSFIRLSVKRLFALTPGYIEKFCTDFKKYLFEAFPDIFYLGDAFVKISHSNPVTHSSSYGGGDCIKLGDTTHTGIRIYKKSLVKMFDKCYEHYHVQGSCIRLSYYKNYIVTTLVHELFHYHQYRFGDGNRRAIELSVQYYTNKFLHTNKNQILSFSPNLFFNIFATGHFYWYGKITLGELKKENPKISNISLECAYTQFLYSDDIMISKLSDSDAKESFSCFRDYIRSFSIVLIEIDNMSFTIYDEITKYAPFHLFVDFISKNAAFYRNFKNNNYWLHNLMNYGRNIIGYSNYKFSKITFKYDELKTNA